MCGANVLYQMAPVEILTPLLSLSFLKCGLWEAIGDSSGDWLPAIQMDGLGSPTQSQILPAFEE